MPPRSKEKTPEEEKVISTAIQAITERYGSLKDGFIALLSSKQPPLIRFVFEHAVGKPKEQLDIDTVKRIEHIQVIQLPHNNRERISEILEPIEETIDVKESAKILNDTYGQESEEED